MKDIRNKKDKKVWIIVILCIIALLMVTGFATFAQITAGKKPLTGNDWNIGFKSAKVISERIGKVTHLTYNRTVAYLNTTITGVDGKLVIDFIVENKGSLDAKVKNIYFLPYPQEDDILIRNVKGIKIGDVIKVGKTKKITMTIEYNENSDNEKIKELISSNLIIDYVQA